MVLGMDNSSIPSRKSAGKRSRGEIFDKKLFGARLGPGVDRKFSGFGNLALDSHNPGPGLPLAFKTQVKNR